MGEHAGQQLDQATLDRSLLHGVAWTGSVKWATQIATWLTTLIVARVLSPDDYGLVGMAAIYFGFLTLVSEAGLGMTVIALRELRGNQLLEVHTFGALMGLGGFAISGLVAWPLARFFGEPALTWVIVAMSINFILVSLRTVPQAVMQRDLSFRKFAALDGTNSIITASAAVLFALLGFRYWSLVISTLLGSAATTGLALWWKPLGFRRPRFHELRETLRTSREILIASVAWYVFQSADFFVAGKLLGKTALGTYTVAWNLAYSIVEKVTTLVNSVTSSIFSAAKHDRALLTRYITRITGVLALVLLPSTAGVALVARELVLAALGEKWRGAIVPLTLLVLYAGVRSLNPVLSQALMITGDTRYAMRRNIIGAICLPIAFVIGAKLGGIVGIATAWMVVHAPVVLIPQLRRVSQQLGIGLREYTPAVGPPFVSTVIMAVAVLLVAAFLPANIPLFGVLAIKVLVGGVAYVAALWFLFRGNVMSLIRAFAQFRRGVEPAAGQPT
jgi:PST family polysaccharide transporter